MSRVLVLDNIRSLHNVGAILRTCDGAGWNKVYLTGYTGSPPDRRIEKVSLGAETFVEWETFPDACALCEQLKADGYALWALEQTETSEDIFQIKNTPPHLALILGNEVEGVQEVLLSRCDKAIEIPMRGQKVSLNVSVAAGIAMYVI